LLQIACVHTFILKLSFPGRVTEVENRMTACFKSKGDIKIINDTLISACSYDMVGLCWNITSQQCTRIFKLVVTSNAFIPLHWEQALQTHKTQVYPWGSRRAPLHTPGLTAHLGPAGFLASCNKTPRTALRQQYEPFLIIVHSYELWSSMEYRYGLSFKVLSNQCLKCKHILQYYVKMLLIWSTEVLIQSHMELHVCFIIYVCPSTTIYCLNKWKLQELLTYTVNKTQDNK
jgi:hypothetical protein